MTSLVFFSGTSLPTPVKFWMSLTPCPRLYANIEGHRGGDEGSSNHRRLSYLFRKGNTGGRYVGSAGIQPSLRSADGWTLYRPADGFLPWQRSSTLFSQQKVAIIGQLKYILGTWFWFYLGGTSDHDPGRCGKSQFTSRRYLHDLHAVLRGNLHVDRRTFYPFSKDSTSLFRGSLPCGKWGLGFMARTVPQMKHIHAWLSCEDPSCTVSCCPYWPLSW